MAPFPIPTLVAQSMSALYNPCKDLFLYLKGERQHVKDLEDKITSLITDLIAIKSSKKEIDRTLELSVSTEKSDEYRIVETNVAVIDKKFAKFITKYKKITSNLPSTTAELGVSNASDMIEQLEEIKTKIWTRNFFELAKLSRDIAKLNGRASGVLARLKPEYMIHKKKSELDHQVKLHDYDTDLPGLNRYVDEVLGYLSENGKRIGIVGPVGVGKTTVLTKLYNQLIHNKSLPDIGNSSLRLVLDKVIRTTYPQELETEEKIFEKLQNEIMVQLKIDHERTNSIIRNADTISEFLRQKKYILLMDGVSKYIDLNKLGLQLDHKYGKVVIASSDKKAISWMIEHKVEIEKLSKDDAWKLFENICGKIYDGRKRDIADRIIECCGGLPGVIKLMAKHLKDKEDESSWNDAKRILQSHTKSVNLMGLGGIDNVYKKMYEELETASKKCLLYGALFPNEHIIYKDYLIECWMAERFIDEDVVQRLRVTRERGQTILDQLTDLYLLEWCNDKKYVKMPPNFRRVALEQEYPDEINCVIWAPLDHKKPNEKIWRTATRMSLIACKSELPESPECSNIYTLLLQFKPELERLADCFFFHMQNLRVLDLHHTEIGALPGSIGRLVDLRSLNLTGCRHLAMLPPEAAKLEKLEFLDICGTSIPSLPQEIKCMVDLRCLRASFYPRGCTHNSKGKEVEEPEEVIIPLQIISNLRKLEELSIHTSLHSQGRINMADELAMEMASLEYLTTLRFNFPNVSSLNTFVTHSKSLKNIETDWKKHTFRSFKIFIGCHETQHPYKSDVSDILAERRLRFSNNEEFSSSCKEVLKQARAFELIGYDSVETLSEFDLDSLQVCVIEGCHRLRNIVDGHTINEMEGIVEESAIGILQNLEKLHLYDLQLLQCIWEGPVLHQSLVKLTVLTVNGCPKLTKIFDPSFAHALSSLKHLKVENCSEISKIVEDVPEGSNNAEQIDLSDILNNVEIVELSNLPQLQSICKSTSMKWNSLKAMVIISCSKLRNLSLTQTNAKKLASIECEYIWWTPLQLPNGVKQCFLPFCNFVGESLDLGARPEGETSTTGSSVNPLALSNIDSIIAHGENRAEEIMPSNHNSTDHLASNINADSGASRPEEEIPIPASNIDARADSSRPADEIPSIDKRQIFSNETSKVY